MTCVTEIGGDVVQHWIVIVIYRKQYEISTFPPSEEARSSLLPHGEGTTWQVQLILLQVAAT